MFPRERPRRRKSGRSIRPRVSARSLGGPSLPPTHASDTPSPSPALGDVTELRFYFQDSEGMWECHHRDFIMNLGSLGSRAGREESLEQAGQTVSGQGHFFKCHCPLAIYSITQAVTPKSLAVQWWATADVLPSPALESACLSLCLPVQGHRMTSETEGTLSGTALS